MYSTQPNLSPFLSIAPGILDPNEVFMYAKKDATAHLPQLFGLRTINNIGDYLDPRSANLVPSRGEFTGSNTRYVRVHERDVGEMGRISSQGNYWEANTPATVPRVSITSKYLTSTLSDLGGLFDYNYSIYGGGLQFEPTLEIVIADAVQAYCKTIGTKFFDGLYADIYYEGNVNPIRFDSHPNGIVINATANGLTRDTLSKIAIELSNMLNADSQPTDLVMLVDAVNYASLVNSYKTDMGGLPYSFMYYGFSPINGGALSPDQRELLTKGYSLIFAMVIDRETGITVVRVENHKKVLFTGSASSGTTEAQNNLLFPVIDKRSATFLVSTLPNTIAPIGKPLSDRHRITLPVPFGDTPSAPYSFDLFISSGGVSTPMETMASAWGFAGVVCGKFFNRIDVIGKTTQATRTSRLIDVNFTATPIVG